jgi:hypothetical protein
MLRTLVVNSDLNEVDDASIRAGAPSMTAVSSIGRPRLQASRLAVPAGTNPIGIPEPAICDDPDRSITARADHKVDVFGHRHSGHRPTRVLGRGFQPQRVDPAVPLNYLLDHLPELLTDLRRVVQHGAPTSRPMDYVTHKDSYLMLPVEYDNQHCVAPHAGLSALESHDHGQDEGSCNAQLGQAEPALLTETLPRRNPVGWPARQHFAAQAS